MQLTNEQKKEVLLTRIFPDDIEIFGRFFFPHHFTKATPNFHREIYRTLQSDAIRIVRGAPRGHAKSTIVSLIYLAWAVIHKRAKFVLLVSDTYSQSVLFLEAFKTEIESNERLRGFYGNLQSDKWKEGEVVVGDTMIKALGAGMKVRGLKFRESRPDLIIADDLENDELVENQERREKLERWWNGAVIPSLADNGRVVVIGTVLHFDSLLMKMLDETRYTEYNKQVYAAVMDGKALWPEHQSLEKTEQIKAEYAAKGLIDQFYREYMNEIISPENQKFKSDKRKFYVEEDLNGKQLNTYITIDRAYSMDKTADFTGIIVLSVDDQNNWYVRVAERFKGDDKQVIDKLFGLWEYWNPNKMGVEQKAFRFTLKPHLEDEMRRRNVFFQIEELKDEGISKIRRIEGLVPRYMSGSLYVKREHTALIDEMDRFPRASYDDLLDALAHQLPLAEPPNSSWKAEQDIMKTPFDPYALI